MYCIQYDVWKQKMCFFSRNKKKDAHLMLSRVRKIMSGEQSKIVVYFCRYIPEILIFVCWYFAKRQGFYPKNLKLVT